jgi:hypothetical protein
MMLNFIEKVSRMPYLNDVLGLVGFVENSGVFENVLDDFGNPLWSALGSFGILCDFVGNVCDDIWDMLRALEFV